MPVLRYLNLLSLVVWIGGIIFFAFVLAPTVFAVLPTHQLAGNVVSRSLSVLHWMGLACGLVFAATSLIIGKVSENGSSAAGSPQLAGLSDDRAHARSACS